MIPSWLNAYANETDLREIESAIAKAETRTSGEIVPMIVRQSILVGHVPVIGTLLAYAFFMTVLPYVKFELAGPEWAYDIAALVLSVAIGWTASKFPSVRRLFTSQRDEEAAVLNRAQLEFYETGIPQTAGRTGVLIFVSLLERRAVVLGDETISAKLNEQTWVEVIGGLLAQMKKRELKSGFTEAIAKVGVILEKEFPIKSGDTNELPNTLVVKD